jgi:hypothetical protein
VMGYLTKPIFILGHNHIAKRFTMFRYPSDAQFVTSTGILEDVSQKEYPKQGDHS